MTLSEDLKERVINLYLSDGLSMREVATLLSVSLGFVHNVVACHRRFWQVNDPRPRFYGQHRILNGNDIPFIYEVIGAQPTIYLDEIQHKLATVRGVQVSLATVSRTLFWMGLTRKALSWRQMNATRTFDCCGSLIWPSIQTWRCSCFLTRVP